MSDKPSDLVTKYEPRRELAARPGGQTVRTRKEDLMPDSPVFFVVEKTPLGESAALYCDAAPQVRTAKPRIIYITRLDQLPNAKIWLNMSLNKLYAAYCKARDGKRLPPPPKLTEGRE